MSYFKKVDYNNNKACFDFLTNHFQYPTLNSWNGLKSIAHNVKVYNLPDIDSGEALQALEEDQYLSINQAIKDWEEDHPGYGVGFNGRSGGYLVLYNDSNNGHCFNKYLLNPCECDDYEEFRATIKTWGYTMKEFHPYLIDMVKLVQSFDQLCDDLVALTKELIKDMKRRQELTRSYSATLRFQRYYYETLEDLKLHMVDMKRRGYSVFEYSDTDLYAEYEMNETIDSEIVLDEEDE